MENTKVGFYKEVKRIQLEMKVEKTRVVFTDKTKSKEKYRYRNLEDILIAWKKVETDLVLIESDEVEEKNGFNYIVSIATLTNGEYSITAKGCARENFLEEYMSPAQATGSASAYARKGALNALFCIDDSKDPDERDGDVDTKQTNENNKAESNTNKKEEYIYAVSGYTYDFRDQLKKDGFTFNGDVGFFIKRDSDENLLDKMKYGKCDTDKFDQSGWNKALPQMKEAYSKLKTEREAKKQEKK